MPASTPAGRLFRVRERLRMSLWLSPALAVVLAIAVAEGLVALDRRLPSASGVWLVFAGGPESARNLLSVIAGSMVTSISLIFSVTMIVFQLASAQYSPRILRSFIRDGVGQNVLGVYIATFVYCLVVLPSVRAGPGEGDQFVPSLAVTAGLALSLVSLALFVRYVHHIAHAIRAVTVVKAVATEAREALARMYPDELGDEAEHDQVAPPIDAPATVVDWSGEPGVVVAVDEHALLEAAVDADVVVRLRPTIGAFVPHGAPIVDVVGTIPDPEPLLRCITVGDERTIHQDPAYGLRQLVDIAERALSPGVNDPTTAVQVIDQLHDLLRRLVRRQIPSSVRADDAGVVRVVAPRLDWDDYVGLAFDEIRHYSGRSIQVVRRLHGVLDDLLTVAPPGRCPALERQRRLLAATGDREFPDAADAEHAEHGTTLA